MKVRYGAKVRDIQGWKIGAVKSATQNSKFYSTETHLICSNN